MAGRRNRRVEPNGPLALWASHGCRDRWWWQSCTSPPSWGQPLHSKEEGGDMASGVYFEAWTYKTHSGTLEPWQSDSPKLGPVRKRAEYCFESTVSEKTTHWASLSFGANSVSSAKKTRWARFGTRIIGWKELTEFAPRNSVSPEKLTELSVWNRAPRNRIRPVSDL